MHLNLRFSRPLVSSSVCQPLLASLLSLPLLLTPGVGFAQSLAGGVSHGLSPTPQSAAVDDSWALRTNPAGLSRVKTFQLSTGWTGDFGASNQHLFTGQFAFSPLDDIAFGVGGQVLLPLGAPGQITTAPFAQGTFSSSIALGKGLSAGASVHAMQGLSAGSTTRWRFDFGSQIRPSRYLAVGVSMDNLGADGSFGAGDLPSLRTGISVRPFLDWVSLGLDTRLLSGNTDLTTATFYSPNVEAGAHLRVDLGGLGLLAGVKAGGLGFGATQTPYVEGGMGIEINTNHLGATFLGGYSSDGINGTFRSGVLARMSAESYSSVFPSLGGFKTLTLTGNGVPAHETDGLIDEFFSDAITAPQVLLRLKSLPDDDSVRGLVIRLRGLSMGWGRAMEIRRALKAVSAAGKTVVMHLDSGGDQAVFLASVADKIYVSPAAQLDLDGLTMQLTYVADALESVGVEAVAITAGAYKSAPRMFTHNGPSPEQIEAETAILDGLYKILLAGIAEGRDMKEADVNRIIEKGGLNATEALEKNIVDGIAYFEDLPEVMEEEIGYRPHFRNLAFSSNDRDTRWDDPPQIAIVPILGDIVQGRAGGGLFGVFGGGGAGADDVIEALHKAEDDDDIKAVVLRIDSPGGDALASDLIWKAVMDVRKKKPVIASMANMAASGGYYIAAGAQEIYAEEATLTGSIGVFTLFFQGEKLSQDLGIRTHEIQRGASAPNMLRAPTDEERARIQKGVDWIYERFLSSVKEGRDITDDKLRPLAGGRVWTGAQARENGLVDRIGGLGAALDRAHDLAGIDETATLVLLAGDDDESLPDFGQFVRVLTGVDAAQQDLQLAVRWLVGDPQLLTLLTERRTLAKSTVQVVIE
ncbi:MAG: signal peptide peptidase SppA [Deltaproteobacteria bacterium]|nr:signal peptide peptidase SppA [Deltaproteobacteria bacterium]